MALQPLSDDHHRALVLARRLRRQSSRLGPAEVEALARETRAEFEAALEPHFQVEERFLLSALQSRGAGSLADRTAADHARLRALVQGRWDADVPAQLGTLLEEHVRFEERSVFPTAEDLLSAEELAAVQRAAMDERGRRPRSR